MTAARISDIPAITVDVRARVGKTGIAHRSSTVGHLSIWTGAHPYQADRPEAFADVRLHSPETIRVNDLPGYGSLSIAFRRPAEPHHGSPISSTVAVFVDRERARALRDALNALDLDDPPAIRNPDNIYPVTADDGSTVWRRR